MEKQGVNYWSSILSKKHKLLYISIHGSYKHAKQKNPNTKENGMVAFTWSSRALGSESVLSSCRVAAWEQKEESFLKDTEFCLEKDADYTLPASATANWNVHSELSHVILRSAYLVKGEYKQILSFCQCFLFTVTWVNNPEAIFCVF